MECAKKVYTSGYCLTVNNVSKLHDKLERFRKSRKFRLRELEEMPKTRANIRRKAKALSIQSDIYEIKGFTRRMKSYRRQSWALKKTLKEVSRYRKMKEIHRCNRSIREVKTKINDLETKQISRGETIKELLFQEFIECCS